MDNLDWERKKAYVHQVEVDYYTDAITKTDIKVLSVDEEKPTGNLGLFFGEINVNSITTGYKKIKLFTHENVGAGRVYLPELEMATNASWIEFPDNIGKLLQISEDELSSGLQAMANAIRNIAPIYVMCDPNDIRSLPMVRSPFSHKPTIYIYDNYPGGIGLSFKIFNDPLPTIEGARDLIAGCECESGCPSCVGPLLEVGEKGKVLSRTLLGFVLEQMNRSKN